jgi:hypothetical protein
VVVEGKERWKRFDIIDVRKLEGGVESCLLPRHNLLNANTYGRYISCGLVRVCMLASRW